VPFSTPVGSGQLSGIKIVLLGLGELAPAALNAITLHLNRLP
jgi:hypothetical protein